MNYGRQISHEREELRIKKEKEEIEESQKVDRDRREEMAKFPWIDEELNQRKEECCERLFLDALKRMGVPPS